MSERDEDRHVAAGDAAPAAPADPGRRVEAPASGAEEVEVEVTGPAVDAEVLQAVVDFIDDLVESDEDDGHDSGEDGGAGNDVTTGRADGRADGEVPPKGGDT